MRFYRGCFTCGHVARIATAFVAIVALGCVLTASAAQKYWVGSTSTSANVLANWADDTEGTAAAALPADGDVIVVSDLASNRALLWNLDIEPGGWLQTNYTGTVTFRNGVVTSGYTVYGTAISETYESTEWNVRETRINGDVALWSGTWTHTAQPELATTHAQVVNGLGVYRLQVKVSGSVTVGPDAKVSANERGFYKRGPGSVKTSGDTNGSSHGGSGSSGKAPYGSTVGPRTQGSGNAGGGSSYGGGVVRLQVGGTLTLNGAVTANATPRANAYAASGGSVWLTAGKLLGAGTVSADGESKTSSGYHPASGGRVAIVLTGAGAAFEDFTGSVTAYGGGQQASASSALTIATDTSSGTIYLETAADGAGKGTLLIKGRGTMPSSVSSYAGLTTNDSPYAFSCVIVTNGARLGVMSGVTLNLDGFRPHSNGLADLQLRGAALTLPRDCVFSNTYFSVRGRGSSIAFRDGTGAKHLTLTNVSAFVNYPLTVDGSLTLAKDASLSHSACSAVGSENYLDVTLAGDLTVASGGLITAKGKGYPTNTGPGKPTTSGKAASHGGLTSSGRQYGQTYGSLTRPYTPGSGGLQAGGGVIKLTVGGKTTLKGRIDADALNYGGGGAAAGSGGSVWLTTGTLAGSANIRACGGYALGRRRTHCRHADGRRRRLLGLHGAHHRLGCAEHKQQVG